MFEGFRIRCERAEARINIFSTADAKLNRQLLLGFTGKSSKEGRHNGAGIRSDIWNLLFPHSSLHDMVLL